MRPFFSYYGGKWRVALDYPKPQHRTLIEPFAGAAGYATRYPHLNVVLLDKDPRICALWDYLIHVSEKEILELPLIGLDQNIHDFPIPPEAKDLIGFWLNKGATSPGKQPSKWMRSQLRPNSYWGKTIRERIAKQVGQIRHWQIQCESYEKAPDLRATWFIDPPYQQAGIYYKESAKNLDFQLLGQWCQERKGQVMVCEQEGANWLPFVPFRSIKSTEGTHGKHRSLEVLWTQEDNPFVELF